MPKPMMELEEREVNNYTFYSAPENKEEDVVEYTIQEQAQNVKQQPSQNVEMVEQNLEAVKLPSTVVVAKAQKEKKKRKPKKVMKAKGNLKNIRS